MRTIIAGSRSCTSYATVCNAADSAPWEITTIISGTAPGVDRMGELYAAESDIPLIRMPADWTRYGRGAGKIRNIEMALVADALVAVWDGYSKGTGHMIDTARAKGLKIHVVQFDLPTTKMDKKI